MHPAGGRRKASGNGKFHSVHVPLLELSQMAAPGGLGSVVWLASLEIECGRQALRWCPVTLVFEYPYHGSGAMTRSPSPLAWRPDFPGAPREAH